MVAETPESSPEKRARKPGWLLGLPTDARRLHDHQPDEEVTRTVIALGTLGILFFSFGVAVLLALILLLSIFIRSCGAAIRETEVAREPVHVLNDSEFPILDLKIRLMSEGIPVEQLAIFELEPFGHEAVDHGPFLARAIMIECRWRGEARVMHGRLLVPQYGEQIHAIVFEKDGAVTFFSPCEEGRASSRLRCDELFCDSCQ